MKKYFLIGIIMAIVPNICFGYSARFTQLAREKERKMAELEKCMGSTKGLKIAGISTLGLSAVGVAANVVEAKKIKDYDSSIESTQQQIEKTKTEIDKKTDELQKKSLAGQTNDESTDNYDENIVGVAFLHNGTCRVYTENHKWNDVDEKQCSEKLSKGSWLVTKDGESITGDSMCASNGMNVPYVAPGITNYSPVGVGEYCWCKINFGPGAYDNWILSTDAIKGIPYICENYCAHSCAYATLNNSLSFSNTPTESNTNNNSDPKSNEGNSDNPTNSDQGSGNSNSGNNDDSPGHTTCGNLGQKECKTNYKICEKDGQTKDCTGDMLPQHATSGHCVSAGRKDYKICTATDCDDKHTLSNGHCNTQKTQSDKNPQKKSGGTALQSFIDINGTSGAAENHDGSCDVYNGDWHFDLLHAQCGGLSTGQWSTTFPSGTIIGTSICANNSRSHDQTGTPNGNNGKYCWCKMTSSNINGVSASSAWVFSNDLGSAAYCTEMCATNCSSRALSRSSFRRALATGSGN